MEAFKFHSAAYTIYHYFWHTFADKIIEASKPHLRSEEITERATAFRVNLEILSVSLKLLHPFMPFITEEIYQKLPIRRGSGQAKNKPRRRGVGAPTEASEKLLMIENW